MLNPNFKELLTSFNDKKIDYLVVGGYALAIHGYPRFTGDIDLWLFAQAENARRIHLALAEFGFGSLGLTEEDFLAPNRVIQLGYPPSRIDLLTDIDGVTFDEAWPRRVIVDMDGLQIPFIGKADLIRNKTSTGRLQDLADVEKLRGDTAE